MTLVLPQGYAQIIHSFTWTGDPEPFAVTYAVKLDLLNTDPNAVAQECSLAFDNCMPQLADNLILTITEARCQYDVPPLPPAIGIHASSVAGGLTTDALPQNNAFLIHKFTARAGQSGRGRMYLPGVVQGAADDNGLVDGTIKTNLNLAFANLVSALNGGTDVDGMYLLHDSEGAAAGSAPDEVTALITDNVIATQRRRLRR